MKRSSKKSRLRYKKSASYSFMELLFFYFRRILRNPAAAIMMLTLLQVMMLPQAEAKKDFDWSEVPEDLDLDVHEMDPRDFDVKEMDLDITDLTDSTQVHEITDLRTEDITEEYRRYLAAESGNSTDCLAPPKDPGSFFQTIGGVNNGMGSAVVVDSDDNAWLCGYTTSFGAVSSDILLVKLSSSGELLDALRWGGAGYDSCSDLAFDNQGSLWLTGDTSSFGARKSDIFLAKVSSSGKLLQALRWGGSDNDSSKDLAIDAHGSLWLTGYTRTRSFGVSYTYVLLMQFSSSGVLRKALRWGGSNSDYGEALVIDLQSSLWLTGYTYSFGASKSDAFIVKVSPLGEVVKALRWGGAEYDESYALAVDTQGSVWATGCIEGFGSIDRDVFLFKFSSSGELTLALRWGGSNSDCGRTLSIGGDGSILLAGYTFSFSAINSDVFLAKFSSTGDLIQAVH